MTKAATTAGCNTVVIKTDKPLLSHSLFTYFSIKQAFEMKSGKLAIVDPQGNDDKFSNKIAKGLR